MQIDHLRYFIALDNLKSVTKISHFFNTTPQNVSRILKNLEAEMDDILFIRTEKGIALTPEGEQFLDFAKTTVYQFDELRAKIQFKKTKNQTEYEVTLFSNNVINEIVLNDILIAFFSQYPAIMVKNMIVDWKTGYQNILQNPEAIAFLYYLPEENQLENFLIVPALQSHPVAIMSKNHPLAKYPQCYQKQLVDYKFIVLTQNDVADTEAFYFFRLHPAVPKVSIANSGNLKYCYQITANSDYICPGSLESFLRQEETIRKNLVAVPIIDIPVSTHSLIKSKNLPQNSPQNLLFTFILNYLQKTSF